MHGSLDCLADLPTRDCGTQRCRLLREVLPIVNVSLTPSPLTDLVEHSPQQALAQGLPPIERAVTQTHPAAHLISVISGVPFASAGARLVGRHRGSKNHLKGAILRRSMMLRFLCTARSTPSLFVQSLDCEYTARGSESRLRSSRKASNFRAR